MVFNATFNNISVKSWWDLDFSYIVASNSFIGLTANKGVTEPGTPSGQVEVFTLKM
jgi:hypothetical protein